MMAVYITMAICVPALLLMYRHLYLQDQREKKAEQAKQLQDELDAEADRKLEDELKQMNEILSGGNDESFEESNKPTYEDFVFAAATYELDPEDRKGIPFSWPFHPNEYIPTADQGDSGRIKEIGQSLINYLLAIKYMDAMGLEIPLRKACEDKTGMLYMHLDELIKKEVACVANSPDQ